MWWWFVSCVIAAAPASQPDVLRFASGLRVVFEQRPGLTRTASAVLIDVGEEDAAPGQEQLAHLVEHLAFRAVNAEGFELRHRIRALGCLHNGFTGPEHTVYLVSCPDDATVPSLDVWADLLRHPLLGVTPQVAELERSVVQLELEEARHPELAIQSAVFAHLKRDPQVVRVHPEVGKLNLDAARALTKRAYRLDNAVLAVVTSRDKDELQRLLETRFGPLEDEPEVGSSPVMKDPPLSELASSPVKQATADVDMPVAVLAYELPPSPFDDGFVVSVLLGATLRTHESRHVHCRPLPSVPTRLVCSTPGDRLVAHRLRERADIRGQLDADFLHAVLAASDAFPTGYSRPPDGLLDPVPGSRPWTLATWMAVYNHPPQPASHTPTKGEVQQWIDLAKRALDPANALVLALVPSETPASVPELPASTLPPSAFPPSLAPVSRTAAATDHDGFVAVERPDLGRGVWAGVRDAPLWIGPPANRAPQLDRDTLVDAPSAHQGRFLPPPDTFEVTSEPVAAFDWSCVMTDAADVDVMVFGAVLEERVRQRLREQRGWSYSPHTYVLGNRLLIMVDVLPEALPDALQLVEQDVRAVAAGQLTPHELDNARRWASVKGSTSLATTQDWPTLALGLNGPRTAAMLTELPRRIASVDLDAVASAALTCAATEHVRSRGPAAVGDALRTRGQIAP